MKTLKYISLILALLLFAVGSSYSQTHTLLFYNVENLYDTIDNPSVIDEDQTPEGKRLWNSQKYWEKIDRITEVYQRVAQATGSFPILIGAAEIENIHVLRDLANSDRVAQARYQIVHYDSPDRRGVDVAFFYRPDVIEYVSSYPIPVRFPDNPTSLTRDILWFTGKIDGQIFHFFNNHWPSRWGGQRSSEPRRLRAASILRHYVDSLKIADPEAMIVIMGDFNDNPGDRSMTRTLRAKGTIKDLKEGELFNPFLPMHKDGHGTLGWNDVWSLFDMVIVSQNMVGGEGRFQIQPNPGLKPRGRNREPYYGFIFNRPFLMQREGRFKGYPWRTYIADVYQGGYSDHFPVYILISK
ncbi:MAG: endonuclease/exonuclease/phosphatase family protein [Bacteroidales bacterium]|nr:endonuclease/exonuclease/phosphatase family protein [Bacteroidales bacterium]